MNTYAMEGMDDTSFQGLQMSLEEMNRQLREDMETDTAESIGNVGSLFSPARTTRSPVRRPRGNRPSRNFCNLGTSNPVNFDRLADYAMEKIKFPSTSNSEEIRNLLRRNFQGISTTSRLVNSQF